MQIYTLSNIISLSSRLIIYTVYATVIMLILPSFVTAMMLVFVIAIYVLCHARVKIVIVAGNNSIYDQMHLYKEPKVFNLLHYDIWYQEQRDRLILPDSKALGLCHA